MSSPDKMLTFKKIGILGTSNSVTKKEKESKSLLMENIQVNGERDLKMVREKYNIKKEILMRVSGSTIIIMVKELTLSWQSSMESKNTTSTQDSSKMVSIMEKALCNTLMEINMKVNGPLARRRERECTNGRMEIIMTGVGKKIQPKVRERLVSGVFFMMGTFTSVPNMASANRPMRTGI